MPTALGYISSVEWFAGECRKFPIPVVREITEMLCSSVQQFPYRVSEATGCDKGRALLAIVPLVWIFDKARAYQMIGEAEAAHAHALRRGIAEIWVYDILVIWWSLSNHQGTEDANEFLDQVFLGLPERWHSEVADDLLLRLTESGDSPVPKLLSEFGIWLRAQDQAHLLTVEHLLPWCSYKGEAVARLTLAATALLQKDGITAKPQLDRILAMDRARFASLDSRSQENVWTLYALLHGSAGVGRAAANLMALVQSSSTSVLHDVSPADKRAAYLLKAWVPEMPDKATGLRQFWDAIQVTEEFGGVLQ